MSAWITSKELIDSLLQYCITKKVYVFGKRYYDLSDAKTLNKVGQILVNANYKSVNYRYSEKNKAEKYNFSLVNAEKIHPVQVLKSVNCLEYQCCEFSGWHKSEAKEILNRIVYHVAQDLAGESYESAQWDF